MAVLVTGIIPYQLASAQFQQGGVDHDEWCVGEGLKLGDYFSYKICHLYYKDCSEFTLDL